MAAGFGAVLLVSLWVPWYSGPESLSAWEALGALDVVLALVAAAAVALALITATQRVPAVPIALAVFVTWAGILGVVLVLLRVVSLPDAADGRDWGLWLALVAVAGIVASGLVAMRDERLSKPGRHTDPTGKPATPPEIETHPAPRH